MSHNYGSIDYWEGRYQKDPNQTEWLQRFASEPGDMAGIICDMIPDGDSKILVVGCGFSRMSEELADEGYTNVTSIDISYNAINLCKEEYAETYSGLIFK